MLRKCISGAPRREIPDDPRAKMFSDSVTAIAMLRFWARRAQTAFLSLSLRERGTTSTWALALLLWTANSLAADIQVRVDRNPVRLDESFHIIFSATEQPDENPDFAPLRQDFDIRDQGQSSQMSVVNGQYSRQIQWTVTAMAKRAGDLAIPSIAFGSDLSPALGLRVEAGTAPDTAATVDNSDLFIEVTAEPKNPYVQAQVLYTVRILHRIDLGSARLEEPKLDNAVLELITKDSQYTTQRKGQAYHAIERRYAIFPQQSGRLTIQPPVLEAAVAAGGHSLFNRFFMQQNSDTVRLRGKTIELDVRPIPAQFSGKHWLPAKQLSLSESLSRDPPQVAAGEPLTRTLKLQTQASTIGNLPELAPEAVASLQAYPDQPALKEEHTPEGLNASREEKIALIPVQAGNYTLPSIALPWWNTQTDREEIARIPPRTLTVTASTAPPLPALARDAVATAPVAAAPSVLDRVWIGVAAFCALGWLLTVLAWWFKRCPLSEKTVEAASAALSAGERRRRLHQACQANDATVARQALLAFAKGQWPENPPRHLDEVAARAGQDLAREIEHLNRASYSASGGTWNGADLWQALQKLPDAKPTAKHEGLEPLYRT